MIKPGDYNGTEQKWLVAEYCGHDYFMGWHLYLRDTPGYQERNKDGGWGWLRKAGGAREFLESIGCPITGDGSMDSDGIAAFARRYPLPGKRVWRKKRGGVLVVLDYWGHVIGLAEPSLPR